MNSPLFSVILTTYRRDDFLEEAVRSVLAQTEEDFECLVVDDGTPDPIRNAWRDSRIKVVRREMNGGPAAARNSGISEAQGTYLTFLDDDDIFEPERLSIGLRGLSRAPVSFCWRQTLQGQVFGNRTYEGSIHDVVLNEGGPGLHQVCIRRDVAPRFDESFDAVEDMDWLLRVTADLPVSTVSSIGYSVRQHGQPRLRHGIHARITGTHRLLEKHSAYFRDHPKAAAFRWKRIGLMSLTIGDEATAREAFKTSMRLSPSARTYVHRLGVNRRLRRTSSQLLERITP